MLQQHAADLRRVDHVHQRQQGETSPCAIPAISTSLYPYGWWWPNELVRGKYLDAKSTNVYTHAGSTAADKHFSSNSVFKCPEGLNNDEAQGTNVGVRWPTDSGNNGYSIKNDTSPGAR